MILVHFLLSFLYQELLPIRLILLASYALLTIYLFIWLIFVFQLKSGIRSLKLYQPLILIFKFSLFNFTFFFPTPFTRYFDFAFFWNFYRSSYKIWVCCYKFYAWWCHRFWVANQKFTGWPGYENELDLSIFHPGWALFSSLQNNNSLN